MSAHGGKRPDATVGVLLRRFRGAAGLSQEELAERAGLSVHAVSAIEQGRRRSPHPRTLRRLGSALSLSAEQRALLLEAAAGTPDGAPGRPDLAPLDQGSPPAASARLDEAHALLALLPADVLAERGPLPTGSRMPLAANPLFVGRAEELLQLAATLKAAGTTVALGQVVATTGLGGLGKTQLAVELVHRYGRFFAGGAFWLSFAGADEIPLQVAACAGPGLEALSLEDRVRRARDAWQSEMPRLLVFDNCEEEELLEAWRPTSGGCRVLVTSRRSHWSPTLGVTALALDLLPRADSIELLRRYLPEVSPDDPGLDAIADRLGDLPLALHLAGSYLRAYAADVSLDAYLVELGRAEVVQHASLLGAGIDGSPSPTGHVQSLAQTFALCLGRLDREDEVDQVAIALLARMACLAPGEPVRRDLLARTLEEVAPLRRADGMRRLAAIGLLQAGDGWLRLHRLLAHFVRQLDPDAGAQPAVDRVLVDCGNAAVAGNLAGASLPAVLPHLHAVASRERDDEARDALICCAAGRLLYETGDLHGAEQWYERSLAACERAFGPNHLQTATTLLGLGRLNQERGRLAVARTLLERALAIGERELGPEHPDLVKTLLYLAWSRHLEGDRAAARRTAERALDTCERAAGYDQHPDTSEALHTLGSIAGFQGDLNCARLLLERAVAGREQRYGKDHHLTARSLNNLGLVLAYQGELAAARPVLERALAIGERVLGADHYLVTAYLDSLAALLTRLGDLAAAGELAERALLVRERTLGPDHPGTAQVLHTLGLVVRARGEPVEARALFERALAIRERVMGPDHPDTTETKRALAAMAEGAQPIERE